MKYQMRRTAKKFAITSILVLIIVALAACGDKDSEPTAEKLDPATEAVLANFQELAKIPRESGNEQEVSNYLKAWAEERGFEVVQDEYNNIIFDVPATEGMENVPLTAFQVHMDMVVAVKKGNDFEPDNDPITVKREGNFLTAEGTSLGADDGIGIAIVQYVVENNKSHGPLRVIITVNEEDTTEGAINLDASYLDGVAYLINVDNEESDVASISSASHVDFTGSLTPAMEKHNYDCACRIAVGGSDGGHSGNDIDRNRMNSNKELFRLLNKIQNAGLDFCIVKGEGGFAINVIPTDCSMDIVCNSSDKKKISGIVEEFSAELKEKYGKDNSNPMAKISTLDKVPEVAMSEEATGDIIAFANDVPSGVYTMSSEIEGLVECSSNLGLIKCNEDEVYVEVGLRSSASEPEQELGDSIKSVFEDNGFDYDNITTCAAWPVKEDNKLLAIILDKYQEQNGEEMKSEATHAGLECGWFAEKNPEMDIVSIGPDIENCHSVNERCHIDSIAKVVNLIDGVIEEIGKRP